MLGGIKPVPYFRDLGVFVSFNYYSEAEKLKFEARVG
jgi:hypothetical protein